MSVEMMAFEEREPWEAARNTGLGGSDAATVLGNDENGDPINPYSSRYELWASKTGRAAPRASNAAMRWGHRLEQVCREAYAEETQRAFIPEGEPGQIILYRNSETPWMLATPDGKVMDSRHPSWGVGVGEIKTSRFGHGWGADSPPLMHVIQCQHYMAVTGRQWASICGLLGGNEFKVYDVRRNDDFIGELIRAEEEFWRLVMNDEPPTVDGSEATARALRAMHPQDSGEVITLPAEAARWLAQRQQGDAMMKGGKAMKDEADNNLKAMMGAATYGEMPEGMGRLKYAVESRKEHKVSAWEGRVLRHLKK